MRYVWECDLPRICCIAITGDQDQYLFVLVVTMRVRQDSEDLGVNCGIDKRLLVSFLPVYRNGALACVLKLVVRVDSACGVTCCCVRASNLGGMSRLSKAMAVL